MKMLEDAAAAGGGTACSVLLLEDDEADAELIEFRLREAGFQPSVTRVEDEAGFAAALKRAPDVILADYRLPQFSALGALRLCSESAPDVPFIIVSGAVGEETAVEAMKLGATDYVLKDRLARLGPAVSHALDERRVKTEKREAEERLRASERRYRTLFARARKMESALRIRSDVEMRSQDRERRRIGRELHDEVGQALAVISVNLERIVRGANGRPAASKILSDTQEMIQSTLDNVRRISRDIHPAVLDHLGLTQALKWQARKFSERTGLKVRFREEGRVVKFQKDQAAVVFRILQEALTNALKHARARHVDVAVEGRTRGIRLVVQDDGRGFRGVANGAGKPGPIRTNGVGILGIRERVRQARGTFSLKSKKGKGTTLLVEIPSTAPVKGGVS